MTSKCYNGAKDGDKNDETHAQYCNNLLAPGPVLWYMRRTAGEGRGMKKNGKYRQGQGYCIPLLGTKLLSPYCPCYSTSKTGNIILNCKKN